jgi:tetratricopeptide (TPR) repeat protein
MLFDLRGRGRRRTVQVIYLGLAILIGAGLVFFGIGGAVSGGLFDAIDKNDTSDPANVFAKNVKSAQAATQRNPTDAAAWAALAKARYQLAGTGDNFNETSGFTDKGRAELAQVNTAWQKYLSLDPKKPDVNVARLMVSAYDPAALDKPDDAVTAMELVVDDNPTSANLYGQLAILAFTANQTRKAELAEKKALSLEKDEVKRAQIKQAIDQAKQQQIQAAAQAAGATTTQSDSSVLGG